MKHWLQGVVAFVARWGRRVREGLTYFVNFEPAMLRSTYVAVVLVLGWLGIAIPTGVDAKITGWIAAATVVIPNIQGWLIRMRVVPQPTYDADVATAAAALPPGDDDVVDATTTPPAYNSGAQDDGGDAPPPDLPETDASGNLG